MNLSPLGVELCSLTNPDDLVSSLTEEKHTIVTCDDDEEIDVVNIHNEKKTDNATTVQQEACYLPHFTDTAVYVKQIASQVIYISIVIHKICKHTFIY